MADSPALLCSEAQFQDSAFGDLAEDYKGSTLADVLAEATRMCESAIERRLVPFTTTETHRATGIDPDEYSDAANLPLDIRGTLGRSYASSIGSNSLVRHCWLDEFANRYADMWSYTDVSVAVTRSYGGSEALTGTQILSGPEPDTGHLWFQLGVFLPVGSRIAVTFTAGYTTIPADLVRAGKFMTAYLIMRELNPEDASHDPDQLHADALLCLAPYARAA